MVSSHAFSRELSREVSRELSREQSRELSSETRRTRTHDDAMAAAVALHLTGDVDAAEHAYRRILMEVPRHAVVHNNLGTILAARGERGAALACYATAAEIDPGYGEAFRNFGLLLCATGRARDAVPLIEHALTVDPARSAWWCDLGVVLVQAGALDDALDAFDRALRLGGADASAHIGRSSALAALGALEGACEAALAAGRAAPHDADVLAQIGMVQRLAHRFVDAKATLTRALMRSPDHPVAQAELAHVLAALGAYREAKRASEWLTLQHPDRAASWNVHGAVLTECGELDAAERAYHAALARGDGDVEAQVNLAFLSLLKGDLADGFARLEHRVRVTGTKPIGTPEWEGESLDGRTILVHAEQGLGDQIQFARYLPLLRDHGAARVIATCAAPLVPLLSTIEGVELFACDAPLPAADVHARLLGLPLRMGTASVDTVPRAERYLSAPPRPVAARIRAITGLRVGLAWQGNRSHPRDHHRSMGFATIAPLLDVPGVRFVSLQPVHDVADDATPDERLLWLGAHDVTDAAAAIAELDLVIAVDSAIGHLAGALGVPVWLALSALPDWRWMMTGDETPWYPRTRLVRQREAGEWGGVVEAMARGLRELSSGTAIDAVRIRVAPALPQAATPDELPARRAVSIGWPVGPGTGWGTYGLALTRHLARSSRAAPVLAAEPMLAGLDAREAEALDALPRTIGGDVRAGSVHLAALGNGVRGGSPKAEARHNVGVAFIEDTALDEPARGRARAFDQLVAGSTWNAELLRATGHPRVTRVLQGIDPATFHPDPSRVRREDRFVIFSGGKLEFRKGQDLVVAAFRAFHARHRMARLVTAWHNAWPATMVGIDRMRHVTGLPEVQGGRLLVSPWLAANGIPAAVHEELGPAAHDAIAAALHRADVALFPNRAEGGTNLVAMEAMACGVPCLVAANTGQLDLLGEGGAIGLATQRAVVPGAGYAGTEGWGESDVEEMVEALEAVWRDRAIARVRGLAGAALVGSWTWTRQCEALLDAVTGG